MEIKNRMELHVTNENKLYTCSACRCVLATKVWTPLKHITDHTKPETLEKLDARCWIWKEQ
jgi:hypothetical protein